MTDNPKVEEIRRSVKNSYEQISNLVNGDFSRLAPEKLYAHPLENEWSVMENLAHIIELMPYWGNEVAKLVANPGQKFGRTMQDENRVGFISEHANDTLEQVRVALPQSYARLDAVLSNLKDSDLILTGVHSRFGEKPLEWFMHEFVTSHLANHVIQLKSLL